MRRVSNRFLEGGVEHALSEEPRRRRSKLLDSAKTAALIAMVCGPSPEGRARWTIPLVADEAQRRKIVRSLAEAASPCPLSGPPVPTPSRGPTPPRAQHRRPRREPQGAMPMAMVGRLRRVDWNTHLSRHSGRSGATRLPRASGFTTRPSTRAGSTPRRSKSASCLGSASVATASRRSRSSGSASGSGMLRRTGLAARSAGSSLSTTPSESLGPTGATESCQSTSSACASSWQAAGRRWASRSSAPCAPLIRLHGLAQRLRYCQSSNRQ
ncbi:helix-turn-helix domain-containing protein [Sorangium atrum]|uniref:helix-turn-helix domain-containing protein n=1 Tax=Sorangium atrum TaxID=2995308 RepID=UPI00358DD12E